MDLFGNTAANFEFYCFKKLIIVGCSGSELVLFETIEFKIAAILYQ